MPTVSKTYDFRGTLAGWAFDADAIANGFSDGADGIDVPANDPGGGLLGSVLITVPWTDLGVPADQVVSAIQASVDIGATDVSGAGALVDIACFVYDVPHAVTWYGPGGLVPAPHDGSIQTVAFACDNAIGSPLNQRIPATADATLTLHYEADHPSPLLGSASGVIQSVTFNVTYGRTSSCAVPDAPITFAASMLAGGQERTNPSASPPPPIIVDIGGGTAPNRIMAAEFFLSGSPVSAFETIPANGEQMQAEFFLSGTTVPSLIDIPSNGEQMQAEFFLQIPVFGPAPVPRLAHIDIAKSTAVFWYHENRLYASFAGRTYCRDFLTEGAGWTDAGYGYVNGAFVTSRFNFPAIAFLCANMKPTAYGDRTQIVSLTHRNMTPQKINTDIVPEKKVRWRPFGNGVLRESHKRGRRIRVWGTYQRRGDRKIGRITWQTENGWQESTFVYDGLYGIDLIIDQQFPDGFVAWLPECELELFSSVVDCDVLQAEMEFVPQN